MPIYNKYFSQVDFSVCIILFIFKHYFANWQVVIFIGIQNNQFSQLREILTIKKRGDK
jgi:hypothetical protein